MSNSIYSIDLNINDYNNLTSSPTSSTKSSSTNSSSSIISMEINNNLEKILQDIWSEILKIKQETNSFNFIKVMSGSNDDQILIYNSNNFITHPLIISIYYNTINKFNNNKQYRICEDDHEINKDNIYIICELFDYNNKKINHSELFTSFNNCKEKLNDILNKLI